MQHHTTLDQSAANQGDRHQLIARDGFDWAAQVKLAVVLSAIAVVVTLGLAGRVAEPVLIVGIIVVASVLAWRRVEVAPRAQPARVTVRHR